ncbi:MAG: FAD-dependent monooxygenase [Gammaproteobacteria bacterium]|nr:FAD-dependent monooxygenase [Gammaproteobacteria bacterium]
MTHVLIAGGGIGGLSAALSLAQSGFEVEVFEQAPEFGEVGAGIQLSPNATRVLHHLGLAEALEACAFLPEGTEFRSWRTGRLISNSPLGESARASYGFPYYHVHRGDLLAVLVAAARTVPRISLHTCARVDRFEQDANGVHVTVAGVQHAGDALIGGDGIHSAVRAGLFGPEAATFTGNVAWRALVPVARLPDGLIAPAATVWWGPGGHFVCYYVRRGALVNCVCVREKQGWEVESWTERGEYTELKDDFAGWNDTVQALIDNADPDALYKWALHDRPPMRQWGRGAVTLLGDACHPTLPFMAQGAAMAIEDGAVLAACLRRSSDVPAALSRYENLRKGRTAGIQRGSRRNARAFHMRGVQAWLRNRAVRRAGARAMASLFEYDALTAAEQAD